jgi:HD-GYP domain-containing protein (c-di-GMP phosphodiesterase class II)
MQHVSIHDLKPGMIVGEDIFGNFDLLYAPKGEVLTERLITGISRLGHTEILIESNNPPTPSTPVNNVPQTTEPKKDYSDVITHMSSEIAKHRLLNKDCFRPIRESILNVFNYLILEDGFLGHFDRLLKKDPYSINHSIHVSMLSALIGEWLLLSENAIYELALAGMLHDIGKTEIPESILKKPDPLRPDEWLLVQNHPEYSFDISKDHKSLSHDILQAIANHHERMDGSGYPNQLTAADIHPYAKIMAVADVFDAMTTKRYYGELHNVFEAADILFQESLDKLDPQATDTLLRNLHKLYVGTKVRLSNQTEGEIVYVNKFNPNKPLIKSGEQFYDMLSPESPKIIQIL